MGHSRWHLFGFIQPTDLGRGTVQIAARFRGNTW